MPGAEVEIKRPQQPERIDAVMGIEAPVFHGDEGGRQIVGHILQLQPLAHHRAAMARRSLAVGIQEGEGGGPVHRIKIDMGIKRRGEQAEKGRQQIEQRPRHGDRCDDDGEDRHQPVRDPTYRAEPVFELRQLVFARHGRNRAPIFTAVSRPAMHRHN